MSVRGLISPGLRYCGRHPYVRLALAALLLATLAGFIVVTTVWWPVDREYTRLQDGILRYRQQAASALLAEQLLQATRTANQAVTEAEKKLQTAMGQSELIRSLAQLASRDQVQILSQSFEEGKPVDRYSVLRLELTLQGSYKGMRNYIRDLTTLNAWIAVEEARLERAKGSAGLVKANLHLVAYRQSTGRKTE